MKPMTLKKINHISLTLSKCFYKVKWYLPGRLLGKIRQDRTLKFLEKNGIELLQKEYNYENLEIIENPPVFIMWFQGEDNFPEIIRKCVESIRKNIKNREIIIITRENILDYADIPACIMDKVDSGAITKTYFSDIARSALLYKNGGSWLDAAIFLTKEVPEEYFNNSYYCPSGIKSELKKDFKYLFRGTNGWNVSFQGTNVKKFPLYDFIYHYNVEFFSKYPSHVDYFQNDFLISLFLKHNSSFKEILSNKKPNNIYEFELALLMNKEINKKTLKQLSFLENNFIHKLTYKKNWKRFSKNGKQTVLDYIVYADENKNV